MEGAYLVYILFHSPFLHSLSLSTIPLFSLSYLVDSFFRHLETLNPSAIDFEFHSLSPPDPSSTTTLSQFLWALQSHLMKRRDFEAIQCYLTLFLRIHGESIVSHFHSLSVSFPFEDKTNLLIDSGSENDSMTLGKQLQCLLNSHVQLWKGLESEFRKSKGVLDFLRRGKM